MASSEMSMVQRLGIASNETNTQAFVPVVRKRSNPSGEDRTTARKKRNTKEETKAQRDRRLALEHFQKRKADRLAGRTPANQGSPKRLVHEAIRNQPKGDYKTALEQLPTCKPTEEQIAKVHESADLGPNYFGRTASVAPGFAFDTVKRGSNGFTSQDLIMPAADVNVNQSVHASLLDMTLGELKYMLGQHLIWSDIPGDEFMSYSKDPLFLVIHALNRHHERQGGVTIQFCDRRRAKDVKGQQAALYHALDLYETFEVPCWSGWKHWTETRLRARKFTQELRTHGAIKFEDDRFRQASVQTLIDDGLPDLFPAFEVPIDHLRAGLYTGQVLCRSAGYPPGEVRVRRHRRIYAYDKCAKATPMTIEVLHKVQKIARNFMTDQTDEPHLYIFLSFLTFEKRLTRDDVFIKWIDNHYTASDVIDLYDDGNGGVRSGFTNVANNLPGVMQYLDLVRDCCHVFSLPDLPANVRQSTNALTEENYAGEDARLRNQGVFPRKYDKDAQQDKRAKAKKQRQDKKAASVARVGAFPSGVANQTATQAIVATPRVVDDASAMSDVLAYKAAPDVIESDEMRNAASRGIAPLAEEANERDATLSAFQRLLKDIRRGRTE